jgi:dolichol-phosphate mannosyltransferase
MMGMDKKNTTIVIPTLNEEEAIGNLIDELRIHGYGEILVVDGYSRDHTIEIAQRKRVTVINQLGSGKRDALKTAFEIVKTPFLVVMDGDLTYDPADIEHLFKHSKEFDQVVGARRMSPENMIWLHRVGNRIITYLFNVIFGTKLNDVCSGMYLIRTERAKALQFNEEEFAVEIELLAQTSRNGGATDITISYRKRRGKSHIHTWRQGVIDLVALFSLMRRYNIPRVFSTISMLGIALKMFSIH